MPKDPQEGDRVLESETGHTGTVVEWKKEHDPSTVYVDHVRIASRPRHTGSPRFCSRSREIGPLQQSGRQVDGLGRATA